MPTKELNASTFVITMCQIVHSVISEDSRIEEKVDFHFLILFISGFCLFL
jgi:hypothetical protein